MTTLVERIDADNVRLTFKYMDYVNEPTWPHHLYKVTLYRKGRQWTLSFKMGSGLTDDPDVETVLYSVLSDTLGYVNCSGFLDWADEYGYNVQDPDIRSEARKTYNAVKAQSARAEQFFQNDFNRYVHQTDWNS